MAEHMSLSSLFPTTSWLWRSLWSAVNGRIARRVYLSIILLFLFMSVGLRAYTYLLTGRMQAVVAGLSKLQIDKSTEQELVRLVPYLEQGKFESRVKPSIEAGDVEAGQERFYSVTVSNEPLWMRFYNTINFLKICSKDAQL